MALAPKNFKFKKYFKGKIRTTKKNKQIQYGDFAIKALESGRLTPKQIESARRTLKKILKPIGGLVKRKIRTTLPVTSKPIAVRMGRGKGKVAMAVSPVKKGSILFEIYSLNKEIAIKAAEQAAFKLPIKTLFIQKLF
jgi:large subunit ribosomal protein L16